MRHRVYCMSLDRHACKLQLDWRADALTQSNPASPEASCSPLLTFCIIFNSPIIEPRNNSSAAPHLRTPVSFYLVRQIKDEGGTCFGGRLSDSPLRPGANAQRYYLSLNGG